MTQRERVLKLLRDRGSLGLNTTDLHAPTCDGGPPILRLAARILDLEHEGYRIERRPAKNRTATYMLCGEPEPQIPLMEEPPEPRLFTPNVAPVSAIGGEWEDAA